MPDAGRAEFRNATSHAATPTGEAAFVKVFDDMGYWRRFDAMRDITELQPTTRLHIGRRGRCSVGGG